jgi:glycosyltransferase involved in cell wall biosynthesis
VTGGDVTTSDLTFILPFSDAVGGAQVVTDRLVRALGARGHRCSARALAPSGLPDSSGRDAPLTEVPWLDSGGGANGVKRIRSRVRARLSHKRALRDEIARSRGTIVLATGDVISLFSAGAAREARRRRDLVVVGHLHSSVQALTYAPRRLVHRRTGESVARFVARWLFHRGLMIPTVWTGVLRVPLLRFVLAARRLDGLVVLSGQDRDRLARWGIDKARVIPNPLPAKRPVPQHPRRRIAMVCRLSGEKNIPLAITAFAEVAADHPDWRLEIVGEGPQREPLTALISSLELGDRVRLHGFRPDPEAVLATACFSVLSSDTEGLPLAVIESFDCGVPVVATTCSPAVVDLVVDGDNGILVPRGDVQRMAAAMRLMMAKYPCTSMREAALRSSAGFAPEAVAGHWESWLTTLRDGRSKPS